MTETVVQANNTEQKGVADPSFVFQSLEPFYKKARAVIGGHEAALAYDRHIDTAEFNNLLIPFSSTMNQVQYDFYKAESELPGFCSQYMRILVAGLLRKRPDLVLPEGVPEDAYNWVMSDFTSDHGSLISFLDAALEEEITTSRAWVMVNFPFVPEGTDLTVEQQENLKPYPILLRAESVINWKDGIHPETGYSGLQKVIIRQIVEQQDPDNEFHPKLVDTVWVHELDSKGLYQIRVYEKQPYSDVEVKSGEYSSKNEIRKEDFKLTKTETNILIEGERLKRIPIFPLNGVIQGSEPILMPLINREVGLYNKVSRRNHLMYGAATYTPVIASDMPESEIDKICNAGLGSWLRVRPDENISILDTPTKALKDYENAINSSILEIARMGIRMMAPDVRDQSGVALEIRNAAQTAQLSTLNVKVSQTMRAIIATMLNWRYGTDYDDEEISFNLSPDFNPIPLGEEWLRLVTEWYDSGKIPRSTFLDILKANDIIPNDYDDTKAKEEIEQDELIPGPPKAENELEVDKIIEIAERQQNISMKQEEKNRDDGRVRSDPKGR